MERQQKSDQGWSMTARLLPSGVPLSKRLVDLMLTIPGLILLSPILGLIGVFVGIFLGSPVLFRQIRPGKDGVPFTVYKFRTMTDRRDSGEHLLSDKERMTGLGRFLRSYSLDELLELFNVLRGEMSLVGPRPLLIQYLGRYSTEQARRHEVLPGMTGWAQINGRDELPIPEKVVLDVEYLQRRSFWFDLKIIVLTFLRVLRSHGVSH